MEKINYQVKPFYNSNTVKILEYLDNNIDDTAHIEVFIFDALSYIDNKYDCSDFRVMILIRVIYKYKNKIADDIYNKIITSLLNYPFSDFGSNSICGWSENHRLAINSSGLLLGQLYKDSFEINSNSNLYELCKKELLNYANFIIKYGIKEFSSNTYYPVSMSAIANIIEFSNDEELVKLFTIVLDNYVFDLLANSTSDLTYNIANARSYIDNKTNYNNYCKEIIKALLGNKINSYKGDESCFISFINKGLYKTPKVFIDIFNLTCKEITLSNSLDINDLDLSYNEESIRNNFALGLFSDYRVIDNTIRYLKEHQMDKHPLFTYLRKYLDSNKKSLTKIKKHQHIWGDNSYIGKGNSYTYTTNNYQLSFLDNYHIDLGSSQQSTNMVNIKNISLFNLAPYKKKEIIGGRNYWSGSLKNAFYKGDKNVMIGIYKLPIFHHITHQYFPVKLFDEVNLNYLNKGYLFGRLDSTNVMVKSNGFKLVDSTKDKAIKVKGKMDNFNLSKYDFINKSLANHYYIYKVDDTLSFDSFINNELSNNITFKNKKIAYSNYELIYGKVLLIDGKEVIRKYEIYNNNYCKKDGNIIRYESDNNVLEINLKTLTRKEYGK